MELDENAEVLPERRKCKMNEKQTYKEFKKWVDNQVNMAEAMELDENAEVLPDMVEHI